MGALGPMHLAGLAWAAALTGAGGWLLWAARARADDERFVSLPGLGKVGNPTCLTLGLCSVLCGYHAAAYSLAPVVALAAVPIGRWWVVVGGVVVAVVGALMADWVERRGG